MEYSSDDTRTNEELVARMDEILDTLDKKLNSEEQAWLGELTEIVRELTLREE